MCVFFTLSFCIRISFYETKLTKDFLLLKTLPIESTLYILYCIFSAVLVRKLLLRVNTIIAITNVTIYKYKHTKSI